MVPTPIRPWATPSSTRPTIRIPRLRSGRLCSSVAINVNTPLSRMPLKPSTIARLVPTLSDIRPAMGRLSRVARYCEPIVTPATTAQKVDPVAITGVHFYRQADGSTYPDVKAWRC